MTNIEIVEDILEFPKGPISSYKDENWESYELHKLGNFQEMHEISIGKDCIFEILGPIFRVQTCSWCI